MKEILFRGKRLDNGEWITGFPFLTKDSCKMIRAVALYPDCIEGQDGHAYYSEGWPVDPETVDQYIGLDDRTGRKIFENDLVKLDGWTPPVMRVAFIEGAFCLADGTGEYAGDIHYIHHARENQTEVVGNIYDNPDNPELLRFS